MKDKLNKLTELNPELQKLRPVVDYVYQRRARFAVLGTVIALYPFLKRPHTNWTEFEKDFRMYDDLRKPQSKKQQK